MKNKKNDSLLCPLLRRFLPVSFPPPLSLSCKGWIIYLPANSQHCQHPVVKIYLCPDKCSSGLESDYSLLPDILLDAVPVYTAVNHRLPITSLHKTRLVFKSGHKKTDRDGERRTYACGRWLNVYMHEYVCVCVCEGVGGWNLFLRIMLVPFYCKVAPFHYLYAIGRPRRLGSHWPKKLATGIFSLVFLRWKKERKSFSWISSKHTMELVIMCHDAGLPTRW